MRYLIAMRFSPGSIWISEAPCPIASDKADNKALGDSLTKLTAHGYGELLRVDDHDPHQYGNGAIFIPTDSITEEMVQPIMDRWLETLAPTSRRGQPPV